MSEVLVGLDVGTTGVKAIAIAADGEVLARAEAAIRSRRRGRAGPSRIPRTGGGPTEEALDELGAATPAGIGLSGQMHGLVALDAADAAAAPGDPLERPAHGAPSARRSRRASGSSGSSR